MEVKQGLKKRPDDRTHGRYCIFWKLLASLTEVFSMRVGMITMGLALRRCGCTKVLARLYFLLRARISRRIIARL